METITLNQGEGKFQVSLIANITKEGIVCQLYGGAKPHVGAVVLTVPRPSLRERTVISCNSSVLPMLGHKEDELAKPIAEKIAKFFQQTVVLVAGIHIDNATQDEINVLVDNCWQLTEKFLAMPI